MRPVSALSAALCAALGLAVSPGAAHAETPVVIEGPNAEVREAILDLLPDRDRPTTLFEAERIAEEAAARATAWLRSEGYYAAEVIPEANETPPSARLVIRPGARFQFNAPTLTFAGDPPDASVMAEARVALAPVSADAPARAASVLEAEAASVRALQNAGYAEAKAGDRRVVVDHASGRVDAAFTLETGGAPVRLGEVRVEPEGLFRHGFLSRVRNWRQGETYTPDKLARLRRDMSSTGAVSRVTTRLVPGSEPGLSDVVLEVEPAKRHAYELGLGYSTTEGIGAETEWTRRNVSGRADALTIAATAGELKQGVSVELLRPHAAGLQRAQRFVAEAQREDSVAFTQTSVSLAVAVEAAPRLRLGLSYGVGVSASTYDTAGGGVENAFVVSGFANTRHDTTDAPLDARDGSIVELRLEPSVSTGDATLGFVRATAEGRIYESVGDHDQLTFAARVRTGWIEAVAGSPEDVPPDRRFYAGGGGSVRGYEYNSIFPEERTRLALTPGGQGLLEGSLEARWRDGGSYGAAVFIDGGNAFDHWSEAADMRWGAGVGFRYDLGFAPLRIDVAVPLDRRDGDPDYALYISLGQAF